MDLTWKRRMQGGVVAFVGFLLSPLSWWNDLFINVPIAAGAGWLVALVYRPAFEAVVIAVYWLTNIVGLILMQKGLQQTAAGAVPRRYTQRDLMRDLLISIGYTLVIVVLVKWGVLKPVTEYFHRQ